MNTCMHLSCPSYPSRFLSFSPLVSFPSSSLPGPRGLSVLTREGLAGGGTESLSLPLVALVLALVSKCAAGAVTQAQAGTLEGKPCSERGGAEDDGEKWQRQGQGHQGSMAEPGAMSWPHTDSGRGGEQQLLFKFPSLPIPAACIVFPPHHHQVAPRGRDAAPRVRGPVFPGYLE